MLFFPSFFFAFNLTIAMQEFHPRLIVNNAVEFFDGSFVQLVSSARFLSNESFDIKSKSLRVQ